jgi:hypothetical protein
MSLSEPKVISNTKVRLPKKLTEDQIKWVKENIGEVPSDRFIPKYLYRLFEKRFLNKKNFTKYEDQFVPELEED